jgi:Flp pilus assembly pilin Flp
LAGCQDDSLSGGAVNALYRLCRETDGQDLVEYALLVTFSAVALVAVWDTVTTALGVSFSNTNAGVQGLWDPPNPGGGP